MSGQARGVLGHPSARKGKRMCKSRDRGLVSTCKDLPGDQHDGAGGKGQGARRRGQKGRRESCVDLEAKGMVSDEESLEEFKQNPSGGFPDLGGKQRDQLETV